MNTRIIRFIPPSECTVVQYSSNGLYIISGSSDGYIEIWNSSTGKLSNDYTYQLNDQLMYVNDTITTLSVTPSNELLAGGSKNNVVYVYDINNGIQIRRFHILSCDIIGMIFSVDTSKLYITCSDGTVKLYGLKSTKLIKQYTLHSHVVCNTIQLYNSEQSIICGCSDGTIQIYDSGTSELIQCITIDQLIRKYNNKHKDVQSHTRSIAASIIQLIIDTPHSTAYNIRLYVCDGSSTVKYVSTNKCS